MLPETHPGLPAVWVRVGNWTYGWVVELRALVLLQTDFGARTTSRTCVSAPCDASSRMAATCPAAAAIRYGVRPSSSVVASRLAALRDALAALVAVPPPEAASSVRSTVTSPPAAAARMGGTGISPSPPAAVTAAAAAAAIGRGGVRRRREGKKEKGCRLLPQAMMSNGVQWGAAMRRAKRQQPYYTVLYATPHNCVTAPPSTAFRRNAAPHDHRSRAEAGGTRSNVALLSPLSSPL